MENKINPEQLLTLELLLLEHPDIILRIFKKFKVYDLTDISSQHFVYIFQESQKTIEMKSKPGLRSKTIERPKMCHEGDIDFHNCIDASDCHYWGENEIGMGSDCECYFGDDE